MNPTRTDLDEEEHVQRLQAQRFHGEEITGQQLVGLVPWQYFRLFEAFLVLLTPLFPDAAFLRANIEIEGPLRSLTTGMKRLSLKEEAVFIATFHAVFADWPEKFFELLTLFSQRKGRRSSSKIGDVFGPFYDTWLYEGLRDPAFDFLREAFADYLAKHYTSGYLGAHQRAFREENVSKLQEKKYLSQEETVQILGVDGRTLERWVEQGLLHLVSETCGQKQGKRKYRFERTSVETLRQEREREGTLSMKLVAQVLGIAENTVIKLEEAGLLTPVQPPTMRFTKGNNPCRHVYKREEIEQLAARLVARAIEAPADIDEVVPLSQANNKFTPLAATLSQVLNGCLIPIDLATDQPLLHRLALTKEAFIQLLEQSKMQCQGASELLPLSIAAASLRVGKHILRQWIREGRLPEDQSLQGKGKRYPGVSRTALALFKQNYISSEEAARLLGASLDSIKRLVKMGLLCSVTDVGPRVDRRCLLLKRERVEELAPFSHILLHDTDALLKSSKLRTFSKRIPYADLISESVSELSILEERLSGRREVKRVHFLWLLKSRSAATSQECARLLGCSSSLLSRWWDCYLQGGLETLCWRHC